MQVDIRPFGELPDGRAVHRVDLAGGDVAASVLSYGGILASLRGPNPAGEVADVALGFDDLGGWLQDPQYIGTLVGRFANRIREARFPLDGRQVRVTANRGPHQLHGGAVGFDKVVWRTEPYSTPGAVGVVLTHHSPDGDEGYPGALELAVTYAMDAAGMLTIRYEAATDAPTVVNLTNHAYFNLAGGGSVLDHHVALCAEYFLPVDEATLPTGDIVSVAGTPLDFRSPRTIGSRIDEDHEQLRVAGGYDHCFVVDGRPGVLRPCATVTAAGRRLEVATTQPGVQFYSGNGIRPRRGRGGAGYGPHSGLCLETQHFPDSPNRPEFPSTRLDPGERHEETTTLRLTAAP